MLECPQFDNVRAQYPDLLQDARDSMRNLMWHQHQKALSDFVIDDDDEIFKVCSGPGKDPSD